METLSEPKTKRSRKRPRAAGEGGIRQRKDGRWEARLTLPNGTRTSYFGATQGDVVRKLDSAKQEIRDGLPRVPGRLTLGEHLGHWLATVIQPNRAHNTYIGYEVCVRKHILPGLGKTHRLAQLQPHQVQAWLRDQIAAGHAPRTVQYAHAVLRAALEYALRQGLVHRNVAKLVEGVRVERGSVESLEPEQVRELLEAARGDRLEAIYVLAVYTGLRRGELLGLEWADVDLARGEVRVHIQAQHGRRGQQLKRGAGKRTIPLADVAIDALRQHRVRQVEMQLRAAQHWQGGGLVFASEKGTPLNPANLWRHTAALLKRAGIAHHRMHLYRHTFASLHLAEGAELYEVSKLLGHSGIQITSDTYGHMTRQGRREAADRIQRAIGK